MNLILVRTGWACTNEVHVLGRYKTEDYDTRDDVLARAMQETLSLREYPGSYGTPAVAPANPVAAATTKYVTLCEIFSFLEYDDASWFMVLVLESCN